MRVKSLTELLISKSLKTTFLTNETYIDARLPRRVSELTFEIFTASTLAGILGS